MKLLGGINVSEIESFRRAFLEAVHTNRRIFICGNGGSASTSQHFAVDLGVGTLKYSGKAIKVISLVENSAVLTATANDLQYEKIFSEQVSLLGESGDLLILISASGNSLNLLNAASASRDIGMKNLTITGFDGGKLRDFGDFIIHIDTPLGAYGMTEDIHMAICHMITECIRVL